MFTLIWTDLATGEQRVCVDDAGAALRGTLEQMQAWARDMNALGHRCSRWTAVAWGLTAGLR